MKKVNFKISEEKIVNLINEIKKELENIKIEGVTCIKNEFINKLNELQEKIKLEIAFIGQYSAGKSTIISALTGDRDIKIGDDVTTDVVKDYPWGKVLLIDTPGIKAGRPDHDKVSIEYMNKADLLVYVITTQGFSDDTANNFRKLAFLENRIDKMMLVINKSSQGDVEVSLNNWINDALNVADPKTSEELYLSVMDAKDYIEALEIEDLTDQRELIEYSRYELFIEKLNRFISEKGILGRLITPLNTIEEYLNRIVNQITATNEDTKNLLELLMRKQFRLKESKKNIESIVNGHIDSLVSSIKKEGNKIANLIEKGGNNETLKMESKNSIDTIKELVDDINNKVEHSIESEFEQLKIELDILMQSVLAQKLLNKDSVKVSFRPDIELDGFDKNKVDAGVDILNNVGRFAEGFATNKEATKLGLEGLKKASGSDAHQVIYKVGKFFGHKFRPYEAVKYANKVAKVGSVVGKVAIGLPFLAAGYEQYSEGKHAKTIIEERRKVRESYEKIANDILTSFNKQFKKLNEEVYDVEIKNTYNIMMGIRNSEKLKDKEVSAIQAFLEQNEEILKELTI